MGFNRRRKKQRIQKTRKRNQSATNTFKGRRKNVPTSV